MANRIQLRRGTAAQWTAANPVLAQGEPGIETDTGKQKFGNGVAAWSALSYASVGPAGPPGPVDDTSVAELLADPTSETVGVLSATILAQTEPLDQGFSLGDSLTFSDGTSWPNTVVGTKFGVSWVNLGRAGWCSSDVAVLAGALDPAFTLAGTIPASGSVGLTLTTTGAFRRFSGATPTWDGYLQAPDGTRVTGTLTHSQSNGAWSFARTTPGDAVTAASAVFHCTAADDYRSRIATIWVGRNNFLDSQDPWMVIRDVDLIARRLTARGQRYVVLGITNSSSESKGTGNYATIQAINAQLAARHGSRYLDIRAWTIKYGLDQAGLVPTAEDNTDIANDVPPRSLRIDSIHYSAAGYNAIGAKVARHVASLGLVAGAIPTAEPLPVLPPIGVTGVISRYHPNTLTGTVDNPVTAWPDSVGTLPLTTVVGTPTLRETAGKRFVDFGLTTEDGLDSGVTWNAPDDNYTIAVAVSWSGTATAHQRFFGTARTQGGFIAITTDGKLRFYPGGTSITAPTAHATGWHTVIVTMGGGTATIYLDGVSVVSSAATAVSLSNLMNMRGFPGMGVKIAQAAVIDHAATTEEVATLHTALTQTIPA